jgi:DNA modification methylase
MFDLNQIRQGDCLALIKPVPDNSVDLIFYSPPYYDLHKYATEAGEIGRGQTLDTFLDSMNQLNAECARVLKPTGNLVINIMDLVREGHPLPLADKLIAGSSLCYIERIVWYIRNKMPVASKRRFCNKHEWLIHLAKTDDYFFDKDPVREPHSHYAAKDKRKWKWNVNGKCPGNVWDIPAYRVAGKRKFHVAAFPIELAERVVKCWSPVGGVVLDPFVGSGTTTLAAKNLGRQWLGFELSVTNVEIARKRMSGELI